MNRNQRERSLRFGSSCGESLRTWHSGRVRPVQQIAGGHHLGSLGLWAASPKGWTEVSFVTIDRILGSGLAVLPLLSSPLRSANASDPPDVPVSRPKNRIPLYDGAALRRDNDIGTSSPGRVVDFSSVVRTIGCEALDLPFDLTQ